jgi:hypothetical protein
LINASPCQGRAVHQDRVNGPGTCSDVDQALGVSQARDRLSDTIEALFRRSEPGWRDDMLLVDSMLVQCAVRARRSSAPGPAAISDASDYGY